MLTSQAMVLATAMAVSGTVVLLACRLQRSIHLPETNPIPQSSSPLLRPCISSGKSKKERNKKKRVRFAKDVVEPSGNNEEYRRLHCNNTQKSSCTNSALKKSGKLQEMPPNRMALYTAILKERGVSRVGYSY
ncbi:PREDICTED: uncharacterized protein LOC109184024 isoform X2 [Ipomoea nil]|uniref:uncharacterized protein LOC109184024 isoform X2 n=1 Tax=Ipomoea nil TaxID=35883 RepID=UPI0009014E9B|nr:PREDICTED: uncharacterized protein LOC109184024 isoform X2 [Ipomoea nil]